MQRGQFAITCLLGAALAAGFEAPASAQVRVMTYNVAQLQGDWDALEDVLIAAHDDDKPGFAAPVSVFIFQEVTNADLASLWFIVNNAGPPGITYELATYTNRDEDDFAGAQAMFYRDDLLSEDLAAHVDLYTGAGRDADRWKLMLNDYTSPDASFYIYSMHLKAGTEPSDASQRAAGASTIRTNAASLPAGSHVIFAGDFNVDGNWEDAYWEFLDPGLAQAIDPLGTGSWSGSGGAGKHTQSPRASESTGGLIGGGMDDRFDFLLPTLSLNDADGISMMPGTYRTLGNDAQHFDTSINTGNNFYYGLDTARGNALADDLHEASDHLPIICEFTLPAVMHSWTNRTDLDRIIVDAPIEVQLSVANDADVVASGGADILNFSVQTSGDMLGSINGQVAALAPPAGFLFPADTSTVGPFSGTIDVISNDEAVENPSDSHAITGDIIRHAVPSFDDEAVQMTLDVMTTIAPNTGLQPVEFEIWNLGFDDQQALLDIDILLGLDAPLADVSTPAQHIGATPFTVTLLLNTDGLAEGLIEHTLSIQTSDEDLAGESFEFLTVNLAITIADTGACPADVNGDTVVDVTDLLDVLAGWGTPDADTNDDNTTDVLDLLNVLSAWGACA